MTETSASRVMAYPLHRRLTDALTGINGIAYCIVLPAILLRLIYTLIPLAETVWLSLTNKSLTGAGRFIGLSNYLLLLRDETLLAALSFTVIYAAASVILETALGLAIALLLMRGLRGKWLSNFIMLLPG
jgi:ABC-type sugar transport system permease subunit